MRVLVTGASGFVGSRLVSALRDAGHDVVALTRDASRYDPPAGVAVAEGDLLDPAFECPAVDAAYYLVHSMGTGGDFEERDRRAAETFAAAASAAGVRRVIYLGGLGEDRDDLSPHLRSRREVERVLAGGDYDLTTLRSGIVVGAGSASFEVVRQLAARLPVMVTPRWVDTECQPVAVADVVACLVGVLDHPETAGGTYDLGGPEVLTYGEVLGRTRAQMGHRLFLVPVPVLSPRLSSYWLRLVTDVPLSVARPLVEGLRNPVLAADDRVFDLLGVERTPFDEAVATALAETRRGDAGGAAGDAGGTAGGDA